ncbi:hypothetical protein ACLQ2Y_08745 [Micromonospora echinospora]|uniref:Uncharacterized protein n=1 Tax=Micromonospora echinospora TaxID=1877 RepID=A0ABR6M6U4_MICEC|nr:hypothetical protein [Micromonospora echinospora]MBB5111098.1 hypothetical protein [Micromonospora echinospora]
MTDAPVPRTRRAFRRRALLVLAPLAAGGLALAAGPRPAAAATTAPECLADLLER